MAGAKCAKDTAGNMLLISSPHGSRLYGLHHENSDYDYWSVYSNQPKVKARRISQTLSGNEDNVEMDLSTFALYADRSSHQVLELMFSQMKTVNHIQAYTDNFVVNLATMRDLYYRTVMNFYVKAWSSTGRLRTKTFRHCVRMALNLEEAQLTGRFNPTMAPATVEAMKASSDVELERWMIRVMNRV